ncbi:uncharacterized protein RJT20DRAFT_126964 [Scheffersomyces xylosifermentans]|uniref:uncharacterized protein n=1 Tax=Scheffersomyces xylosifermentans TaxID=1304137 RepID=UPI00315DBB99
MSHILQATGVSALTATLSAGTYVLEHLSLKELLLDVNWSSASFIPLTEFPTPFFVRQNRKDKQKQIKVFGANGVQLYTFERLSSFNPVWTMLTYPQRKEIATISIGVSSRSVDFHNKPGLSHREIINDISLKGRFRSFYLNDGAKYSWTSGSKFLEKVINPNGGVEEIRERVAKVKLMRQFKLDFEVLVDESKIDSEIALATAFTSMLTQWGIGEITDTIGPTYIAPRQAIKDEPTTDTENKIVVVIENGQDSEISVEHIEG